MAKFSKQIVAMAHLFIIVFAARNRVRDKFKLVELKLRNLDTRTSMQNDIIKQHVAHIEELVQNFTTTNTDKVDSTLEKVTDIINDVLTHVTADAEKTGDNENVSEVHDRIQTMARGFAEEKALRKAALVDLSEYLDMIKAMKAVTTTLNNDVRQEIAGITEHVDSSRDLIVKKLVDVSETCKADTGVIDTAAGSSKEDTGEHSGPAPTGGTGVTDAPVGVTTAHGKCDKPWVQYRHSCYRTFGQSASFHRAYQYCMHFQSHMADIDSDGEMKFVASLSQRTTFWIGLVRRDGNFVWHHNDLTPAFTLLAAGEQTNSNYDCVIAEKLGGDIPILWYAYYCRNNYVFVCEKAAD